MCIMSFLSSIKKIHDYIVGINNTQPLNCMTIVDSYKEFKLDVSLIDRLTYAYTGKKSSLCDVEFSERIVLLSCYNNKDTAFNELKEIYKHIHENEEFTSSA